MADLDIELKGGGGLGGTDLIYFIYPGPPLDPPPILIGNAACYLPSSPSNTIGIPVLWTDRHVLLAFLGDEYP